MTSASPRPDQVDLWWVSLDGFDADDRASCLRWLSESERARHQAFKVESARNQYLAARGLVRTTLSRYRNRAPDQWRFRENPYGRPFIDEDLGVSDLYFSLSHTDGLVACAVSSFPEVGIDAERGDRDVGVAELAATVLAPREFAHFRARPDDAGKEFFFTLWTLKEAYVKARGMGLSLPMNGVWFDLEVDPPAAHFTKAIADEASRWTFRILRPTARHIVSIAASPADGRLTVAPRRTNAINLPNAR